MDGFEAMRVIKAISNLQHVPVIAITGNATNEDRSRALDAGFDDFISKPFRIQELLNTMQNHLPAAT